MVEGLVCSSTLLGTGTSFLSPAYSPYQIDTRLYCASGQEQASTRFFCLVGT